MSTECSTIVWKRDFGNATRKVIAARLADHADDEGRGIWPSVERVAAQCNTSPRTVQRTLAAFVEEGILKVVAEGGKGRRSTTHYDFSMTVLTALPLARWVPDHANSKGDTVSPLENEAEIKGDTDDAKGDTDDALGCHGVTQTVIEPPIEPSVERERANECEDGGSTGTGEPAETAKSIERAFKLWYPTWDGYDQDSEPNARRAWFSLSADQRREAASRSVEYQQRWKASGKSYKLASSTYLSEKRWEKLPPKPVEPPKPEIAKPMGKAWMAIRLSEFIKPMVPESAWPPAPAFVRQMIADGGEAGERQMMARRERYGWPKVYDLRTRMEEVPQKPVHASPDMVALGADFVSVDLAGPVGIAWRQLHERMRLPWLPGEPKYAYFPPVNADADELAKAVAAAFWGLKERIEGDVHAA